MSEQLSEENPYEMLVRREFEKIANFSPMVNPLIQYLKEAHGPVEVGMLTREIIARTVTVVSVNIHALNCRNAPDPSAAVVVVLPEGARLRVLGRAGEWLQVETQDGQRGFVKAEFVAPMATQNETSEVPHEMIRTLEFLDQMEIVHIGSFGSGDYMAELTDRGRHMALYAVGRGAG